MAYTLDPHEVCDRGNVTGLHSRTHSDGWTISGEVHEDYYYWVNDFEAEHPGFGRVWGNFEGTVNADSEDGLMDFIAKHPPQRWDYADI